MVSTACRSGFRKCMRVFWWARIINLDKMGTKHQIFQSFFDPVKRDRFCTSASSLYVNSGRRNKSIRSSPSQRIFHFLASISPDVVNAASFQWDANVHDQDKIKLDILYITTIKVSFQKCDFRPPISTKNFQFA